MNPVWMIRGALALGVVAVFAFAFLVINDWRKDAARLPAAVEALDRAVEERDAYMLSAKYVASIAAESELVIEALTKSKRVTQVIYREAQREDPDCAAWAAAPVLCPLDGVRISTTGD